MTEPAHHFVRAFGPQPVRQLRPLDHDDGQLQFTRRSDLAACAFPAGVAGDDPFDAPRTHQIEFAGERERSARDNQIGTRQQQRTSRGIDEAQRVGVLRFVCERRDMPPADGEEDIRPCFRQCSHGGRHIRDLNPAIAGRFDPWPALQRNQRRCRCVTRRNRVAADLGCERMGCIDHMREFVLPDDIGKAIGAAEAADTRRQRLIDRDLRSAGIGIDRVDPRSRNSSRQRIGFARSAQDEDAHG